MKIVLIISGRQFCFRQKYIETSMRKNETREENKYLQNKNSKEKRLTIILKKSLVLTLI